MRVLLLRPPAPDSWPTAAGERQIRRYPLRFAYLASVLREAGVQVGFVDSLRRNYNEQATCGAVLQFHPDVLYAELDPRYAPAQLRSVCRVVRYGGVRLLLGGAYATKWWQPIVERSPQVEAVILGEVEGTVLEILQRWQQGQGIARLPGVGLMVGKRAVAGTARPPLVDLDGLPYPDRRTVPLWEYQERWPPARLAAPVAAGRGCARSCIFCPFQQHSSPLRLRSPGNVAREIEQLVRKHGVREVRFVDTSLNAEPAWAEALAEAIRPCGVVWRCSALAAPFTPELARAFRRAGCRSILFGPVSPTEEGAAALKVLDGPQEVRNAVQNARKEEIAVAVRILAGPSPLPDLKEAAAFASELKDCKVLIRKEETALAQPPYAERQVEDAAGSLRRGARAAKSLLRLKALGSSVRGLFSRGEFQECSRADPDLFT